MFVPFDKIISLIETSDVVRKYVEQRHPYEIQYFRRFASKNGPQCPFARAAIRRIFQAELLLGDDGELLKALKSDGSI